MARERDGAIAGELDLAATHELDPESHCLLDTPDLRRPVSGVEVRS